MTILRMGISAIYSRSRSIALILANPSSILFTDDGHVGLRITIDINHASPV